MKLLLLLFTFISGALGASFWYMPASPVYETSTPASLYGDPYEKMIYFPWASCIIDFDDGGGGISEESYAYYADNCFVHDGKGIKFKMPSN